jgi:hypothetical protein
MTQRHVLPIAFILLRIQPAHRTAARRDVPGSRLLLTDRAAMLQSGLPDETSRSLSDGAKSGSPPGVGPITHVTDRAGALSLEK